MASTSIAKLPHDLGTPRHHRTESKLTVSGLPYCAVTKGRRGKAQRQGKNKQAGVKE